MTQASPIEKPAISTNELLEDCGDRMTSVLSHENMVRDTISSPMEISIVEKNVTKLLFGKRCVLQLKSVEKLTPSSI